MTPLVLLPGMMCDARLFGPQIAALSGRIEVMVPTLTAHDTMAGLAKDVLATAPPKFALAGLSMGGIVAMEMLAQAPERISRLALMDTNPKAEAPEVQDRRLLHMVAVEGGQLDRIMQEEMKPNYLADGPNRAAILDLCKDMARKLGPEAFIRQSLALRDREDRQEVLRQADLPALVLCGRHDRLCPVHRHTLMHDLLKGSELCIIEDAGHLPTLERPAETTAALVRWLFEIGDDRV